MDSHATQIPRDTCGAHLLLQERALCLQRLQLLSARRQLGLRRLHLARRLRLHFHHVTLHRRFQSAQSLLRSRLLRARLPHLASGMCRQYYSGVQKSKLRLCRVRKTHVGRQFSRRRIQCDARWPGASATSACPACRDTCSFCERSNKELHFRPYVVLVPAVICASSCGCNRVLLSKHRARAKKPVGAPRYAQANR